MWGDKAVTFGAPVTEEALKTFICAAMGANIILSHIVFGAVEAANDSIRHPGERGRLAALIGIISHGAFGAVTWAAARNQGSIFLGVAAASLIHVGWNSAVMSMTK